MKEISFFECLSNTDRTEGNGHEYAVAYAGSRQLADKIIHDPNFYGKYGVMGCDNCSVQMRTVTIYENFDEYRNTVDKEYIKNKALSKLTKEERDVLGL